MPIFLEYLTVVLIMGAFLLGAILAYDMLPLLQRISWKTYFVLYLIGSLLDFYSTFRFVEIFGYGAEGNPVVRYLFYRIGFGPTVVVHGMGITLIILIWLRSLARQKDPIISPGRLAYVLAFARFFAFVWNTMALNW